MRRHPEVFAFVSAPADTHTCPLTLPPPIPRSIGYNRIGDEGASALAAILKETMISNLKCAAARWCSPFCQRPLTLPPSLGSLAHQLCGARLRERHLHYRGHHQALRGAQGKHRDLAQVRRRPIVFAFVSAPVDMPHHPPLLPCSQSAGQRLGPEGGAALAEGLKGNSTLQSLK